VKYLCILFFFLAGIGNWVFAQKEVGSASVSAMISRIKESISNANNLVREQDFENSQYFYRKAFLLLDSIKQNKKNPVYKKSIDSLELSLYKHFSNFNQMLNLTGYQMDEDHIFYMKKKQTPFKGDSLSRQLAPLPLDTNNKQIQKYLDYYSAKSKKSTQINLDRADSYIDDIKKILKMYKIPEDLAYLIILESGVNPFANSYAYASGLWQFIESTGKIFNLKKDWWIDERKNVVKSTVAAAEMLRKLYQNYDDWHLALAAYNCGTGGLNKRIKKHKSNDFWSLFKLPKQTKEYVPKFLALTKIAKNPEQFGFEVNKSSKLRYDTIQLDSCVSLKFIADAARLSYKDIKLLNPELNQWCLPPYAKNYPLMLPIENKIFFKENIITISDSLRYASSNYRVLKGETLKSLAGELQISLEALASLNALSAKSSIKSGQVLKVVVPPAGEQWFTEFNDNYLSGKDRKKYRAVNKKFRETVNPNHEKAAEKVIVTVNKKQNFYSVVSGDNISTIARKFHLTSAELKKINRLKSDKLKIGQQLLVE